MAGKVKYSRVPSSEEEHAIDFGDGTTFDFQSAFDYGKQGGGSFQDMFKSAFTYTRTPKPNIPIMEVESQKSLIGTVISPIVTFISYILLIITLPFSAWFTFKMIKQNERVVVFRLGKLQKVKGPGLSLTLPCIDRAKSVDVRTKAFSVPPQKTITSDGATVEIGAEVYHQVVDAVRNVTCVKDFDHSVRALCQLCLQKTLSRYTLQHVNTDQANIGRDLTDQINETTAEWGVKISKVQISPAKVIQEPNALLEGSNLMNAPLDWLGPLLFPPGTTHLPIQPMQERGLLPQHPFPGSSELSTVANQAIAAMVGAVGASTSQVGTAVPSASSSTATTDSRISPHDILHAVRPFLKASLVQEVKAIFLFKVSGEDGGEFYLDLKEGEGDTGIGLPPNGEPDVTLTLNSNELDKLFSGQMSAFQAYVSGRLKIDGDMHAAMALQGIVENLDIKK